MFGRGKLPQMLIATQRTHRIRRALHWHRRSDGSRKLASSSRPKRKPKSRSNGLPLSTKQRIRQKLLIYDAQGNRVTPRFELLLNTATTRMQWLQDGLASIWKSSSPRRHHVIEFNANWWFWNVLLALSPSVAVALYCELIAEPALQAAAEAEKVKANDGDVLQSPMAKRRQQSAEGVDARSVQQDEAKEVDSVWDQSLWDAAVQLYGSYLMPSQESDGDNAPAKDKEDEEEEAPQQQQQQQKKHDVQKSPVQQQSENQQSTLGNEELLSEIRSLQRRLDTLQSKIAPAHVAGKPDEVSTAQPMPNEATDAASISLLDRVPNQLKRWIGMGSTQKTEEPEAQSKTVSQTLLMKEIRGPETISDVREMKCAEETLRHVDSGDSESSQQQPEQQGEHGQRQRPWWRVW